MESMEIMYFQGDNDLNSLKRVSRHYAEVAAVFMCRPAYEILLLMQHAGRAASRGEI
jgi:hypothetical protein